MTHDELVLAERVREETETEAVFATGQQHNHPIHVMAGRVVVMGYPGWLWSQGYDYAQRQQDLKAIFTLSPDADRLLQEYGVDYVVVGPYERERLEADAEAFRARFPSVIRSETYEIFRTRPADD